MRDARRLCDLVIASFGPFLIAQQGYCGAPLVFIGATQAMLCVGADTRQKGVAEAPLHDSSIDSGLTIASEPSTPTGISIVRFVRTVISKLRYLP
jgi:hypothetical protein